MGESSDDDDEEEAVQKRKKSAAAAAASAVKLGDKTTHKAPRNKLRFNPLLYVKVDNDEDELKKQQPAKKRPRLEDKIQSLKNKIGTEASDDKADDEVNNEDEVHDSSQAIFGDETCEAAEPMDVEPPLVDDFSNVINGADIARFIEPIIVLNRVNVDAYNAELAAKRKKNKLLKTSTDAADDDGEQVPEKEEEESEKADVEETEEEEERRESTDSEDATTDTDEAIVTKPKTRKRKAAAVLDSEGSSSGSDFKKK